MENKLKVYPVMLPTGKKEPTSIHVLHDVIRYSGEMPKINMEICVAQHLYLVSDEEIKEDDWFRNASSIVQCKAVGESGNGITSLYDKQGREWFSDDCKRLEATTDPSLDLPLIPEQWIREVWVANQGKIESVYIEKHPPDVLDGKVKQVLGDRQDQAKQHPEGVVIILQTKDSWTRDEVREISRTAFMDFCGLPSEFNEWFDKNY